MSHKQLCEQQWNSPDLGSAIHKAKWRLGTQWKTHKPPLVIDGKLVKETKQECLVYSGIRSKGK